MATNIYGAGSVYIVTVDTDQAINGNKTFTGTTTMSGLLALGTTLTTQNSFSMTAPGGAKIFTGAGGGTWQVSSGSTIGVSFIAQGLDNQTAPLMEFRKSVAGVVSAVGTIDVDGNTTLKKKVVIPHTWAISGDVKVPSGDTDYILPMYIELPSGQTARVMGARYQIRSGTSVTFDMRIAGANFGATGLVASTTLQTSFGSGSGQEFVNGQSIVPVITAVAGAPKNFNVTIYIEYTF